MLPSKTFSDDSARKHFRKEALALSKLNHPNIATIHDFDTQQEVDFLVMECVSGVTLSEKIANHALSEKEATLLGLQLAEGLAAAHEQNIVHRDLKPNNLRLTPDGRLKILDFGLAKLVQPTPPAAEADTESETRTIVGALPYMSPEQLQGRVFDQALRYLRRAGIEPVPGSLRVYGAADFWHSLSYVTLDVGGTKVRHASFHATPFVRQVRADQNERLLAALRNGAGGLPVVVGADWNTECADRVYDEASGSWSLYEPGDPYEGVSWFDELVYQCEWDYDERGQRRHWADRRPGDVLWSGGLRDAAAVLRAPWQPTTGYHPADGYGAHGIRRRIDAVRVTSQVVGALRAHQVESTDLARQASDHLPVTVEYLPAAIGTG